ncbi:MAG TPA: class I SAM-dependent methyltransferase [Candidatus Acidoferrales bacterium]|nr:class I SAM-dependent methyltransferase [Candidatus Acidoferrales bacterium]
MASASKTAPNRGILHPFDRKYGTDTGGYLGPEDLVKGRENDGLNQGYSAIAPSVFHEACRRWRETLPAVSGRIEAYSFVDVGAGKGRALLLAAESPFRKVIGVELSEELARTAQKNVARWTRVTRPKAKIRLVQGDAAKFGWPRTPLLVYLYNPFACTLVAQMAEDLAAVAASGSGLVDLLYVNPICADTLTSQNLFIRLWTARIPMDEADQGADPYGTTSDLVSVFRLRSPSGEGSRLPSREPQ